MATDACWDDYESGPFCIHWGDAGGCEHPCDTCGHACRLHNLDDGCRECGCGLFVDEATRASDAERARYTKKPRES